MDAPDELVEAVRQAIHEEARRPRWGAIDLAARAVLSVPGIADALARDAAVAEIVARDVAPDWRCAAIAPLYPEAGK